MIRDFIILYKNFDHPIESRSNFVGVIIKTDHLQVQLLVPSLTFLLFFLCYHKSSVMKSFLFIPIMTKPT